ncbi:MAG: B12-binding domain-containing radical SAM protein [Pseudobdellovibrio sp.]
MHPEIPNNIFFLPKSAESQFQEGLTNGAFFFQELKFEDVLTETLKSNATDLYFEVTNQNLKFLLSLFSKLKTQIPDIKINLFTKECLFDQFSHYLKENKIHSVAFGVNQATINTWLTSPAELQKYKRVFYKNGNYLYENTYVTQTKAEEAVLILMPAWNNAFPPFGLAHIASAIDSTGTKVKVLDLNNEFWNHINRTQKNKTHFENLVNWNDKKLYKEFLSNEIELMFEVMLREVTDKTKYVGFSMFGTNQLSSEEAMAKLREIRPQVKIFAGGPQCTEPIAFKLVEQNLCDAVVIGEGEETTIELIQKWNTEKENSIIAGAITRIREKAVKGPHRDLMDVNNLPEADFSYFPLYSYDKNSSLPIYSSRGCVAKCSFCSETLFWKKFRALSPDKIVKMIEKNIYNFGINHFYFNDSLMNGSHKLLEDTCDLIIERGLKIEFSGYARFDQKMKPELLRKMAEAGCKNISFGFESGSQKIIDLMNKKVFVDNYQNILKTAAEVGIESNVCIIVGFPGESWRDFFKTLGKAVRMRNSIANINLSIMEISKNSLIEHDFAKYGIVNSQSRFWRTKNWSNFYYMRFLRYVIFELTWRFYTGKRVSIGNWDAGYLMLLKRLKIWLKRKLFFGRPVVDVVR